MLAMWDLSDRSESKYTPGQRSTISTSQSRLRCPTGIDAGSTKVHRLHRRFGRTHWWILSEPSHVRRRHSDDWTDDNSWHSRHHNETSKLHRSNSGMVQVATTSTEFGKNRTDLVRVKGQSKEDGRSWLELVHRSWCYKAGQCRSWPWGLPRQWTVHASSYQHCRPQLFFSSSASKIGSTHPRCWGYLRPGVSLRDNQAWLL